MRFFFTLALCLFLVSSKAQWGLGWGITAGIDGYQYLDRGPIEGLTSTSSGSILSGIGLGPKFWVGTETMSFSIETQANWGIFALDVHQYKGLGSLAFPMMAKLNFMGLSGFSPDNRPGFSVGGGVQFSRTEWYYVKKEFLSHWPRNYFETLFGEVGYGSGYGALGSFVYFRYGRKGQARIVHLGLMVNINFGFYKMMERRQDMEDEKDKWKYSFHDKKNVHDPY